MSDNPDRTEKEALVPEIINELELRKAELAIKEKQGKAELAFKEKELEAKLSGEKRNVWFTSPLIIAVLSAVFGLLGTGVGAALQGYWNTKLERQKFESSLIQKALETQDKNEAAKSLSFLVEAGIIQSLDGNKISELAKKPDELPVASRGALGQHIERLQDKLIELGFYTPAAKASGPGIFGPKLEVALKEYQAANGLETSGKLDEKTYQKLFGSAQR